MKVITFSRTFPVTHPRKGQPTYFVEKIYSATGVPGSHYNALPDERERFFDDENETFEPKCHTIRGGYRWKVGDRFSPRVWSGKPYASPQIEFNDPIEICKIYDFRIIFLSINDVSYYVNGIKLQDISEVAEIAKNDGLTLEDFLHWFGVKEGAKPFHFYGQILCWNIGIDYSRLINS